LLPKRIADELFLKLQIRLSPRTVAEYVKRLRAGIFTGRLGTVELANGLGTNEPRSDVFRFDIVWGLSKRAGAGNVRGKPKPGGP
jgi:hypothetical protein